MTPPLFLFLINLSTTSSRYSRSSTRLSSVIYASPGHLTYATHLAHSVRLPGANWYEVPTYYSRMCIIIIIPINSKLSSRTLSCYDTALYEVESPVITPGSGTGIVFVILGRRILGEKPGVFQRGTSVVSVSVVHEKSKATLLSLSILTRKWRLWLRTFCLFVSTSIFCHCFFFRPALF